MIVLYVEMSAIKTVVAKGLFLGIVDVDKDDMDIKIGLMEQGAIVA